ncbi:hypothetical protein D0T12_08265 [Actinomadura spongiicola]|uniref:Uncharacterized protein n=1 Tax=Actinomadura spongiicola TaxID=2303421 RepID=A0A372GME9_9ACTN|nr:hypothetical protein [Actinomadura spongiicola]RFS86550.1 hypothetical protein D0T12_08265 [Actinomadura spongiicola]
MTDYSGAEIRDEHVKALRLLIEGHREAAKYLESAKDDIDAVAYTAVVYSAFTVAVRRRFSPTYTKSQVINYVADLRASLDENASQISPRVAESMILAALGDEKHKEREPYGADLSILVTTELSVLIDLVYGAGLDEVGLEGFLREAAEHARGWLEARQGAAG